MGCGHAGLSDPNFGGLIRWYHEVLGETIRPSYLLASETERERSASAFAAYRSAWTSWASR